MLAGYRADTNSAWIARRLRELGFSAAEFLCLPDDKTAIAKAIRAMKYKGILGTTTFDQNGQTELALVTRLVSQDGRWVKWGKSAYARGERSLPRP